MWHFGHTVCQWKVGSLSLSSCLHCVKTVPTLRLSHSNDGCLCGRKFGFSYWKAVERCQGTKKNEQQLDTQVKEEEEEEAKEVNSMISRLESDDKLAATVKWESEVFFHLCAETRREHTLSLAKVIGLTVACVPHFLFFTIFPFQCVCLCVIISIMAKSGWSASVITLQHQKSTEHTGAQTCHFPHVDCSPKQQ